MATIELKECDMKRVRNLNAKNEYGLYPDQMQRLITAHQKGDTYKRALIEYRLTDINYHREVEKLTAGRYDELRAEVKQW